MLRIALKMLMGDKGKYLGIIMGLTFASLLITQQASIFTGLMARTYSFIEDTGYPDIWVMDPEVKFIDDNVAMEETALSRVRGVTGVAWASPMYKGLLRARLTDGTYQICNVFGLDDATLIGGPPTMLEGNLTDLRRQDAVVVNKVGAETFLALRPRVPGGPSIPMKIGDTMEINDNRAVVVGLCQVIRPFQSRPVIYTTYTRALTIAPPERKLLSYVLVGAEPGPPGEDDEARAARLQTLCDRIDQRTDLKALTKKQFERLTFDYYMQRTGIPVNFGIAVGLGFFIGTAIAGQTFFNFTLENMRYFGTLKAMGAGNRTLLRMILLQAVLVGSIGYGLGVGAASLFGLLSRGTELSFRLTPELLLVAAGAITIICMFSALISIRKVMKLEPAIVFKS